VENKIKLEKNEFENKIEGIKVSSNKERIFLIEVELHSYIKDSKN
jgi:hypothetical protein